MRGSFPLSKVCKIRLTFSYVKPLKNLICNYGNYSKNLDLIKDSDCLCHLDNFKSFVDINHGHILTGNLDIVEDVHLRSIMNKGSKFKIDFRHNWSKIYDRFKNDLDIFILKIAYKYVWPVEGFVEWKREMCNLFKNKYLLYYSFINKKGKSNSIGSLFKSIKN